MKNPTFVSLTFAALTLLLIGCQAEQAQTRPFELSSHDIAMDWGITIFQEEPCSGNRLAGGEISGATTFAGIGTLSLEMSSAWDVGNLLDDAEKQYEPTSPAAPEDGPAAPVMGTDDYPVTFQFDPFTDTCLAPGESVASATGDVVFTADGGDRLLGQVVGGETHRLDFVMEGDGIESFVVVEFTGGTGHFSGATGSFVAHTIFRFDFAEDAFVIDLAEVLPGGTVRY